MLKHAKSTQPPVSFRSQIRPGSRKNQRHKTDCEEIISQPQKTSTA